MLIVFIIFFFILVFSLYQYIENAEWEALRKTCHNIIFAERNKKYGAYHQKNRESVILTYVLIGASAFAALAIYTKTIVDNYDGSNAMVFSEVSDTTTFSLNNQNVEETPPSQFNFNGENGDGMPQAKDGQQTPSDTENPEPSESRPKNQDVPKQSKNPEQSIYDFEKELYAKEGGAAEREKIQKEMEKRQREREEKKKQQQKVDGGQGGNVGSNSGTQGKNLAEWNLNGRKPLQGNPDYIKIPGYMCGKGITEKIVVKVRVNSNGDVFDAKSMAPATANPCCVEQALSYAKKSRFEYSSKPIEEGTITYYFKPQ
jgi:hypothetical protein